MWSFLKKLVGDFGATYTVLLMEQDGIGETHQYTVRPLRVAGLWAASLCAVSVVVASLIAFTPVRTLIPGYGTEEIRHSAKLNAMRLAALQDSLEIQYEYVSHLQNLMTGRITPEDGSESGDALPEAAEEDEDDGTVEERSTPPSANWSDHIQPAISVLNIPAAERSGIMTMARSTSSSLPSLQLPMLPPVDQGVPTRGFEARAGHYAVDIAVKEGTPVRAIGDGYVVVADWTQEGGHTIAVQHADGYMSVYKHCQHLLKRVGDHVSDREVIAASGNSGEVTTGPHLHFELWQHGLAQDPRQYVAGW